jgi:hypothetical protein
MERRGLNSKADAARHLSQNPHEGQVVFSNLVNQNAQHRVDASSAQRAGQQLHKNRNSDEFVVPDYAKVQKEHRNSYNQTDGYDLKMQVTKNKVQSDRSSTQEELTKGYAKQAENNGKFDEIKDNIPDQEHLLRDEFNQNILYKVARKKLGLSLERSNSDKKDSK